MEISTISVEEQVAEFFEGVTFIGVRKPVGLIFADQVERLEDVQRSTTNAYRAAAINFIIELYIEQVGKRPNNTMLSRLGDVMDADYMCAVYKPEEEYPSYTPTQIETRTKRDTGEIHGAHIAVDGKSYRSPIKYRQKGALD